ncbi:guard cell S-type anion channel SLAC1-like [Tasmannia lanceolata]|uniref:guard cell S-type anion channel SLAC1-like n=1 Tax=Tasmannia lanceolata TaxID=3420 RepID=UPI004063E4F8
MKMTTIPTSPSSHENISLDIHQGHQGPLGEEPRSDDQQRLSNEHMKFKPQQSLSQHVSLETGSPVLLNRESKGNKEDGMGRSFSGIEGRRKGDFSIFRTKYAIHKQNSNLPVTETEVYSQRIDDLRVLEESVNLSIPNPGRYFAALRGPELDQVKDSEVILPLPMDEKWPFLLRFPISCFGISMGLGSQAILWGVLATSPATQFLNITPLVNLLIWLLALIALLSISITYGLKCTFYFEAIKREYNHPVRVNFFFTPWIVCMFLAISTPLVLVGHRKLHPALWCICSVPLFLLELKIYGQWLSGGKRRLSKVANPSTHLSVVGNFVGAILACKVGWKEAAKFFWAVGFAHYLVVFVTLYQRLPSSESLPKELHPVYSLFIAPPAAASIA